LLIFGDKELMIAFFLTTFSGGVVIYEIKLTTDNPFEPAFFRFGYKFESPEHISVVGHRNAFHPVANGFIHHIPNIGRTIQ
jgi:hypothetical protein